MNLKTTLTPLALVFASALLAGCERPVDLPDPVVPMVETLEIGSAELSGLRRLPARIEASERAQLSFRVNGKLSQMNKAEGIEVTKGEVLAVLDQRDFRTALEEAEAAFERADADFARAKQLIDGGNISRRDYDLIAARYKSTRAAQDQARANLSYTELKAPFDGVLARRFVENFEEVTLGQPIFSLRSIDQVDVKFDAPESLIILVTEENIEELDQEVTVTASFASHPEHEFELEFKEIAAKADAATKTFEVTYLMDAPEEFNVLPGMTADVSINMPALRGTSYRIPTRAVFGDIYMEPQVWVLDTDAMTVSTKSVIVGRLTGDSVEVTEGLAQGDVVITSPTNFLLEGQAVQLAPETNLDTAERGSS